MIDTKDRPNQEIKTLKDVPTADRADVEEMIAAIKDRIKDPEHAQIKKNFDYFEGGEKIEQSLRGGYKRFDNQGLEEEDPTKSPDSGRPFFRAPAQKDNEPWVEFCVRYLPYLNLTSLVVQERGSLLYRIQPVRKYAMLEKELEEIYSDKANNFKSKSLAYAVNTILGGSTAIIPWVEKTDGKIRHRAWDRTMFHALHDADGNVRLFGVFGQRWSKKRKRKVDYKQIWVPGGKDKAADRAENGAGAVYEIEGVDQILSVDPTYCGDRLPVCIWNEPTFRLQSKFGAVTATGIVQDNEMVNLKLANLARVEDYQSFSILLTENCKIKSLGPNSVIEAEGTPDRPVKAGFLSPDAAIQELQTSVNMAIEQLFQTGRIPMAVILGQTDSSSGIHLAIQWFPVQKVADEMKPAYTDNERRLADVTALSIARWQAEEPEADVPEVDATVDFDERGIVPRDDESRMKQDDWDLGRGMKSLVDIAMERNPDLTEEDAIKQLKEVQRKNKAINFNPAGGEVGQFGKKDRTSILKDLEETEESDAE